jgi:beta-lactamase class A
MNTTDRTKTPSVSRNFFWSSILAAFAIGVFFGSGFIVLITSSPAEKMVSVNRNEDFKFIRTAMANKDNDEKLPNSELGPFRYKIKALIDEKIRRNEVRTASVYFRDLNNGNWFGIGEKEKFSPKSLLKLPLMMAYFKWAESNPLLLRKRLTYSAVQRSSDKEHAEASNGLEQGSQYTVNDLIFRMIVEDDNDAYSLLFANIPAPKIDKVFKDLDVEYDPHNDDDSLSLRAFASFYRVLFNASYLNEEMSEKALRYLARSSLKHGMASGIPMNIDIASKYGERTVKIVENGKETELHQMHEFGIIYHPRRPFLIGIMVRGYDLNALTKIIRDITSLVYEEVDRQS